MPHPDHVQREFKEIRNMFAEACERLHALETHVRTTAVLDRLSRRGSGVDDGNQADAEDLSGLSWLNEGNLTVHGDVALFNPSAERLNAAAERVERKLRELEPEQSDGKGDPRMEDADRDLAVSTLRRLAHSDNAGIALRAAIELASLRSE